MITIDKNVPIPQRGIRSHWQGVVDQMEVGDSLLLPIPEGKTVARVQNSAMVALKPYGTFTSRTVEGGVRFWLLEKRDAKT